MFLRVNGYKIAATVEEAEAAVLPATSQGRRRRLSTQDDLVDGGADHKTKDDGTGLTFTEWVRQHTVPLVAG